MTGPLWPGLLLRCFSAEITRRALRSNDIWTIGAHFEIILMDKTYDRKSRETRFRMAERAFPRAIPGNSQGRNRTCFLWKILERQRSRNVHLRLLRTTAIQLRNEV